MHERAAKQENKITEKAPSVKQNNEKKQNEKMSGLPL